MPPVLTAPANATQVGLWQVAAVRTGDGRARLGPPPMGGAFAGVAQRADADQRRMETSQRKLEVLVRNWQHNDYVVGCLRQKMSRSQGMVKASAGARGQLYTALTRQDPRAARAALVRMRQAAVDFEAVYLAARLCVDDVDD